MMSKRLSNVDKLFYFDDEDLELVEKYTWCLAPVGYVYGTVKNQSGYDFVLFHRVVMKAEKGQLVDHKDRNPLNNVKSNLRFCTKSQNAANMQTKRKIAPYKGIGKHKYGWTSGIVVNGKRHYLGFRKDPKEAALLYDAAAKKYFGEFALVNFPE